jgi:hypothetical protein
MAEYPIMQELNRQIEQGFMEDKKGHFSEDYSFTIDVFSERKESSLKIRKNLQYRRSEVKTSGDNDGSELLKLSVEEYEPLHKVIRDLAELLGEGKTKVASFTSNKKGWSWAIKEVDSLEEGLQEYRYGVLEYTTEKGAVEFNPQPPEKNTGTLITSFTFSNIQDLDEDVVGQVVEYIDNLEN